MRTLGRGSRSSLIVIILRIGIMLHSLALGILLALHGFRAVRCQVLHTAQEINMKRNTDDCIKLARLRDISRPNYYFLIHIALPKWRRGIR